MYKRFLSIVLACVLLVSVCSLRVLAENSACGDNVTWTLENGTLTISGSGDMYNFQASAKPWINARRAISSIVVTEGVTSIGEFAFSNCKNVTSVSLPGGLTRIGKMAFAGLDKLTELVIPGGVTVIGELAFMECTQLRSIALPASLTEIASSAFSDCPSLTEVNFQGTQAQWAGIRIATQYGGNDALLNANLHFQENASGSERIGGEFGSGLSWAFQDGVLRIQGSGDYRYGTIPWSNIRNSIISIRIAEGLTSIRRGSFSGCRNLNDITLPDTVTSIGDDAFLGCTALTDITLSNSITHIGGNAFCGCSSLASIRIPKSLKDIGECAFYRCESLKDVYFSGTEQEWQSIEIGVLNSALTTADVHYIDSHTHVVFFDANGGALSVSSIQVADGRTYGNLPVPVWQDHTFLGWFTAVSGGTRITAADKVNLTADQILYAHWENAPSYLTITLDACGGTVSPGAVQVQAGGRYGNLPVPVRDGYTFDGWHTAAAGGTRITASSTVNITTAQTLYAHWTANRAAPTVAELTFDFPNYGALIQDSTIYAVFGNTAKAKNIADAESRKKPHGVACAGMFYQPDSGVTPSMFRSGAAVPSALRIGDYSAGMNMDVADFIETIYITQHSVLSSRSQNQTMNDATAMVNAVKYFENTGRDAVLVCIRADSSGHALLGYKVVEASATETRVYVYDCNVPYGENCYISFTKDSSGNYTNEWYYSVLDWGSNSRNNSFCYVSYDSYAEYLAGNFSSINDVKAEPMEYLTVNTGNASVYDAQEQLVAVIRDGELRTFRDDVYPSYSFDYLENADARPDTFSMWIPTDDYSVRNDDPAVNSFAVTMADTNQSATVTTTSREVTLHVNDREQLNCVQIDSAGKTFSITLSSSFPGSSASVNLSGTTGDEMLSILQVAGDVRLSGVDVNDAVTIYVDGNITSAADLKGRIPTFTIVLDSGMAPADTISANRFRDVSSNAYYYNAVDWACKNGVTLGISDNMFGPFDNCTRGQVVTFLWRAMGEPEPSSARNPFSDVNASDYFYKAVLWAVEKGITTGTSATTFSPELVCSRASIITFLYRAAGEPGKTAAGSWWEDASAWAGKNGIFDGTGVIFTPGAACPRGDVVYYLWKSLT